MNNPDAEGADPVDPALLGLAVPPQQPRQPPNPLLMQPPGIGGEGNYYHAFSTDQSKDPHQGNNRAVMAEFVLALGNPGVMFLLHQYACTSRSQLPLLLSFGDTTKCYVASPTCLRGL